MHCVWTLPGGEADHSVRMGAIKARFSMALPKGPLRDSHILRREKGIWQRRFREHHIRDEAAFAACVRYCWFNPVKHGLVAHPGDWPHSSWHRDGGGYAGPECAGGALRGRRVRFSAPWRRGRAVWMEGRRCRSKVR